MRNFLVANALFWLREYHADGLRVDAVASMLYLDYSRGEGEWTPNVLGGREDLDAMAFVRELNEVVHAHVPGVLMVAEESTAWPGVSRPVHLGGLGFGFKWNLGWMNDTLSYFAREPVHRRYHHDELTFSLMYAFSENYVLPLSHDEVVHGKGSLLSKMPGDPAEKLANLRALYGYMWAHPGKKLLFMGDELAQEREWDPEGSARLAPPRAPGAPRGPAARPRPEPALPRRAVRSTRSTPTLPGSAGSSSTTRTRTSSPSRASRRTGGRSSACATSRRLRRPGYRVALPRPGSWREVLNTDAVEYGGSGVGNLGRVVADDTPWHDQPYSGEMTLPPLGVVWLVPEGG